MRRIVVRPARYVATRPGTVSFSSSSARIAVESAPSTSTETKTRNRNNRQTMERDRHPGRIDSAAALKLIDLTPAPNEVLRRFMALLGRAGLRFLRRRYRFVSQRPHQRSQMSRIAPPASDRTLINRLPHLDPAHRSHDCAHSPGTEDNSPPIPVRKRRRAVGSPLPNPRPTLRRPRRKRAKATRLANGPSIAHSPGSVAPSRRGPN